MFSTFFLSPFCHSLCISSKKKQAREESEGGISQKFDDRKKASSGALEIGREKNFLMLSLLAHRLGTPRKIRLGHFRNPSSSPAKYHEHLGGKKAESLTEVDICSSVFNEDRKKDNERGRKERKNQGKEPRLKNQLFRLKIGKSKSRRGKK